MVQLAVKERNEVLYALLSVGISLLMAWYFEWEAADLIWSVWLSSLLTGWLLILVYFTREVVSLVGKKVEGKPKKSSLNVVSLFVLFFSLVAVVFSSLFLLFHFTVFHIGHAFFLNFLFPIFDTEVTPFPPNGQEFMQYYFPLLKEYLMFLPLALWMLRNKLIDKNLSPITPYVGVVRMHLFIILFSFIFLASNLSGFVLYILVYSVFFFPWSLLFKWRKERKLKKKSAKA